MDKLDADGSVIGVNADVIGSERLLKNPLARPPESLIRAFTGPQQQRASAETIQAAVWSILNALGIDPDTEHFRETPRRVADALLEFCHSQDLLKVLKEGFENDVNNANMSAVVVQTAIPFRGLCVGPRTRVYSPVKGFLPVFKVTPGDVIRGSVGGKLVDTVVKEVKTSTRSTRYSVSGDGFDLQLTDDHPVMTQNGWVRADELQEGTLVPYYNPREFHRHPVEVKRGYSLGYVLGALASDGYLERGIHQRRASLEVRELWFASKFAESVRDAFGLNVRVQTFEKSGGFIEDRRTIYKVQFFEAQALELLERMFGGRKRWDTVSVPDVVRTDPVIMQGFMDAYVDGDGTHTGYSDRILSNHRLILDQMYSLGVAGQVQAHPNGQFSATRLKRPSFTPEPDLEVDLESWPVEMRPVREVRRDVSDRKPYTYYDLTCEPYPVFIGNGVPLHNCAHHLLPFFGKASIGYIPHKKIVGLSKLTRLTQAAGTRFPSTQEEITNTIADVLVEGLDPKGVIVVTEALHCCMSTRGVNAPNVVTKVSALRGNFLTVPAARSEFFSLIQPS